METTRKETMVEVALFPTTLVRFIAGNIEYFTHNDFITIFVTNVPMDKLPLLLPCPCQACIPGAPSLVSVEILMMQAIETLKDLVLVNSHIFANIWGRLHSPDIPCHKRVLHRHSIPQIDFHHDSVPHLKHSIRFLALFDFWIPTNPG